MHVPPPAKAFYSTDLPPPQPLMLHLPKKKSLYLSVDVLSTKVPIEYSVFLDQLIVNFQWTLKTIIC